MGAGPYTGPLVITLVYIGVYYAFQLNILRVKTRLQREYQSRGEKFDRYFGQDREMLAADRIQLNTLEHMPPFLILMWLSAVFASPDFAAGVGAVYLGSRLAYPVLMGKRLGRSVRSKIMLATMIGYLALVVLAGSVVYEMI